MPCPRYINNIRYVKIVKSSKANKEISTNHADAMQTLPTLRYCYPGAQKVKNDILGHCINSVLAGSCGRVGFSSDKQC